MHYGVDHKGLEMVECTRGLLSHFVMYRYLSHVFILYVWFEVSYKGALWMFQQYFGMLERGNAGCVHCGWGVVMFTTTIHSRCT